jgi:hypothetical protein
MTRPTAAPTVGTRSALRAALRPANSLPSSTPAIDRTSCALRAHCDAGAGHTSSPATRAPRISRTIVASMSMRSRRRDPRRRPRRRGSGTALSSFPAADFPNNPENFQPEFVTRAPIFSIDAAFPPAEQEDIARHKEDYQEDGCSEKLHARGESGVGAAHNFLSYPDGRLHRSP